MNIQENATVCTAVATVVYTIGSLLMWWTTQKSLKLSRMQLNMMEHQSYRQKELDRLQYISNVHKNFRELYISVLSTEKGVDILRKELGGSNDDVRKNYYASFLINHCYELFEIKSRKLFDEDFWHRIEIDMKDLFEWSFVKSRWKSIKTIYSPEFQEYIEQSIYSQK